MFPAAESAFIITAPEATLAPRPSLFLVAAALNDGETQSRAVESGIVFTLRSF